MWSKGSKPLGGSWSRKHSTRKLQALAALCLAQYCAARKIQHPALEQLIEHLVKLLIAVSLPAWEQEGTRVDLTGRGDPLPSSLAAILPTPITQEFCFLVDNAVEVGLVDMYAKNSDEPRCFLNRCVRALEKSGVELPVVDDLFDVNASVPEEEGYGLPVSQAVYDRTLLRCRAILHGANRNGVAR
jgi:hypothetical protein